MTKVLYVSADTAEVREITPDLDTLQGLVGGYIEAVTSPDWHLYCDEEGKLKNAPANMRATQLAVQLGWPHGGRDLLMGPVVFLGHDAMGDEADVPERVLEAARTLGVLGDA